MGTITKRIRADGTVTYRAEVRLHEGKKVVARQAKTFTKKAEAVRWMQRAEGLLEAALPPTLTVGQLLTEYRDRLDQLKPMGRTRREVVANLLTRPIAEKQASALADTDLIQFCSDRKAEGAGPATVVLDIGILGQAYREAKPLLGIDLDDAVFRAVKPLLYKLGLISRSRSRSRRPESQELEQLLSAFRLRQSHRSSLIPMADCVEFLVYSCMRLSEMTGLLWDDVDEQAKTVVVRDRKHPSKKEGNNQTVPLLGPAWLILERQPRLDTRIFPYNPESISTAFTRTCQQIGIKDLHLHDLRRHGISRLLELGFLPSEVAAVSGHQDLGILHRIYTAIRPEHLHKKYEGS